MVYNHLSMHRELAVVSFEVWRALAHDRPAWTVGTASVLGMDYMQQGATTWLRTTSRTCATSLVSHNIIYVLPSYIVHTVMSHSDLFT
jgi:hypothetical protein